ncbi:MAG: hypothetical protein AVDCRST_MAG80-681, partial [uncultured Rubrobacteraceae bacterium]
PRRTSLRHPLAQARILGGAHRYLGEQLDGVPADQEDGAHPHKGGL